VPDTLFVIMLDGKYLDVVKSINFILSFLFTKMFYSFKSLWNNFIECTNATALIICLLY